MVIGSFFMTICPLMCHISCRFLAKHQITQVTQPPYSQDLVPCNFWLFPKLKSLLKGKRFQIINEIQENTVGQMMVTGRTVWGPRVSTLKGTEASLSCVQCFLCLIFSSINVSIFHITWLDTFWQTSYMHFSIYILNKFKINIIKMQKVLESYWIRYKGNSIQINLFSKLYKIELKQYTIFYL